MALAVWQATIVDASGDIVPEASIEVLREVAGQPPAQCYSDRDGLSSIGSTFNADINGFVRFFVAGGAYQITATSGAFSRVWRYVAIGRAAETDAGFVPTSISTVWVFDASTADSDPGSGMFRLNNASPASVTEIYIDNENAGGNPVSVWLNSIDDAGNSSNRGLLTIADPDQITEVFRIFLVSGSVVDGTGYRKLTVAHMSGAGSFTAGTPYSISFAPKGPDGEVPGTRTLTAGAGLTGGGDLSANRQFDVGAGTGIVVNANDVAVDKASDANVRAAASNKVVTSDLLESASAVVTLTDAATIAVDWDTFIYGRVQLTANRVLGFPTNLQEGTWRMIEVEGNDGTARTLTFGTSGGNNYSGDLPTLTDITSSKKYLLMLFGRSAAGGAQRVMVKATQSLP